MANDADDGGPAVINDEQAMMDILLYVRDRVPQTDDEKVAMGVFNENETILSDEHRRQLTSWIGRIWSTLVAPATTQTKTEMEATMTSLLRPDNRSWPKELAPFKTMWQKMKSGDFMQPEMVAAWQYLAVATLLLALEAKQENGRDLNNVSTCIDWQRVWDYEEYDQYIRTHGVFDPNNGQTTEIEEGLATSAFVAKIDEIRQATTAAKPADASAKNRCKVSATGCLIIQSIPDASPEDVALFRKLTASKLTATASDNGGMGYNHNATDDEIKAMAAVVAFTLGGIDRNGENCNHVVHRLRWSDVKRPYNHKDWAYLRVSKVLDEVRSVMARADAQNRSRKQVYEEKLKAAADDDDKSKLIPSRSQILIARSCWLTLAAKAKATGDSIQDILNLMHASGLSALAKRDPTWRDFPDYSNDVAKWIASVAKFENATDPVTSRRHNPKEAKAGLVATKPPMMLPPRRPKPSQPSGSSQLSNLALPLNPALPPKPPSTPGPVSEGDAGVKRKRPENSPSSAGGRKKQENAPGDSTSSSKPQLSMEFKDAAASTFRLHPPFSAVFRRHHDQTLAEMKLLAKDLNELQTSHMKREAELSADMAKLASANKDLQTRHTQREAELSAAMAELAGLKAHSESVNAALAGELKAAKDEIARLKADGSQMGMQDRLRKLSRHNADLAEALAEKDEQNLTLAVENKLLKSLLDDRYKEIGELHNELGGLHAQLDVLVKDQIQSHSLHAQQLRGLLGSISGSHATDGNPSTDAYGGQAYGQATQQQYTGWPDQLWALQSDTQLQSFRSGKEKDSEEKDEDEK